LFRVFSEFRGCLFLARLSEVSERVVMLNSHTFRGVLVVMALIYGGWVPVTQTLLAEDTIRPIDFVRDVMPLLSQHSCSTTECHGALVGKGDLRLSPLGSNPRRDFDVLLGLDKGRDLSAKPEQSVLLKRLRHEDAEVQFEPDSKEFQLLRRWIQSEHKKAKRTTKSGEKLTFAFSDSQAGLTELILETAEWITASKKSIDLKVKAVWADGSRADVTERCQFSTTDASVVRVSRAGKVDSREPGVAGVEVRYLAKTVTLPVYVQLPEVQRDWKWTPTTAIDQHAVEFWKKLGVSPVEEVSDLRFFKRVAVHTRGVRADVQTALRFSESTEVNKREQLVDQLLSRPEYADYWADVWTGWLLENRRVDYGNVLVAEQKLEDKQDRERFRKWLREQFASGTPLDKLARRLLTATGTTVENSATVFYAAHKTRDGLTRAFGRAFIGANLRCARCHDHPHYDWNSDDFYGIAACFKDVEIVTGKSRNAVKRNPQSGFINPRTNLPIEPTIFARTNSETGEHRLAAGEIHDAREKLVSWLVEDKRGQLMFARNIVNRYWAQFFQRPLVNATDDLRPNSVERIPGVLDTLARGLIEHNFDAKYLIRAICRSGIYQRNSSKRKLRDEWYGSQFRIMRMPEGAVIKAVRSLARSKVEIDESAAKIVRPRLSPFIEDDVKCSRNQYNAWTPPAASYFLMFSSTGLQKLVRDPDGRVVELIKSDLTIDQIVDDLFFSILFRKPTAEELKQLKQHFKEHDRETVVEDVFWALVNSREFIIHE
jgi:hypothetical protein